MTTSEPYRAASGRPGPEGPAGGYPPESSQPPSYPPPGYPSPGQPAAAALPGAYPPTGPPTPTYPPQPTYAPSSAYQPTPAHATASPAYAPTYAQPPAAAPAAMLSPPPAVPSPAPGRASDAKRKRTWAAWTGLVLAAIATAGIGLGNWGMLATIQLDASPFSTAKWWLTGLLIVSVVPLVALVFCIVALVGKARRVVATIGLALSLVGPAVSGSVGADLGMKDLLRTVVAAGAAPGPDGRSGLLYQLESHGVDIPGWAEPFFEIGVEWLAPDG